MPFGRQGRGHVADRLAVVEDDGPHALVFPCRRILAGWMDAETTKRVDVRPTHWRADPVARLLTQTR